MGPRCWFVVGCYLDPDYAMSIKHVIRAMVQRPHEAALLVVRYLNTNLS